MNAIGAALGLEKEEMTAKTLAIIKSAMDDNASLRAEFEDELYRDPATKDVLADFYRDGKSLLEIARNRTMTVADVARITHDTLHHICVPGLSDIRRRLPRRPAPTEQERQEDVAWFKNVMKNYQLEQNRKKYT